VPAAPRSSSTAGEIMADHTVRALVLAAGASSRMGRCKALLPWRGATFLAHICAQLARAGLPRPVIVVPHSDDTIRRLHAALCVDWALNPAPEDGMLSSLRCGLPRVPVGQGVMVCLVDHPAVRANTYRALCNAARADAIVVPVWRGRRGHPVVFGAAFRDELMSGACPEGARSVVHAHADAIHEISIRDAGIVQDIDTPAEFAQLPGGVRHKL